MAILPQHPLISLGSTTCTKAKLVYPLVATRASLAILYFPCMLAIELVMRVYLKRDTLMVLLPFIA
jgi:hypothetical protein